MADVKLNSKGFVVVKGFTTNVKITSGMSLSAIEKNLKKAFVYAEQKKGIKAIPLIAQAGKYAKSIEQEAKNLGKAPVKEEKPAKEKKPKEKKEKPAKAKKGKTKEKVEEGPPPPTFGGKPAEKAEEAAPAKGGPLFALVPGAEKKYGKEEKKEAPPEPVPVKPEKKAPEPAKVEPIVKEAPLVKALETTKMVEKPPEPEPKIITINWEKHIPSTISLIKQAKNQKPSKISAEIKKLSTSFWDLSGYVKDNKTSLTAQMFNEFYQLPEFKGYLYSLSCTDSDAEKLVLYLEENKGKVSEKTSPAYLQIANLYLGKYLESITAIHKDFRAETKEIGGIGTGKEMNANMLLSSMLYLRRWYLVNKKNISGPQINVLLLKPEEEPLKEKKGPPPMKLK